MQTQPATQQQAIAPIPINQQRHFVAWLHGMTLLLLALHLYVRTFPPTPTSIPEATDPEAAWWGFWPVTYAPVWAVWLGVAIVVGLIAVFWIREITRQGDTRPEQSRRKKTRREC